MRGRILLPALVVALAFGTCVAIEAPHAIAAATISPSTISVPHAHVGESYQATLSYSSNATWSVALLEYDSVA